MILFPIKLEITLRCPKNTTVSHRLSIKENWAGTLTCHLSDQWPWESYSNLLRVSVLIREIKTILVSVSWNGCGDYIKQGEMHNSTWYFQFPTWRINCEGDCSVSDQRARERNKCLLTLGQQQCRAAIPVRRDAKTDTAQLTTCRIWDCSTGKKQ